MLGPLWLLKAYTIADVVFGCLLILIWMYMLGLYITYPSWKRFPWFIASWALWISVGLIASFAYVR